MTRNSLKIASKVNKTAMLKTFVNLSNVIRRRLIKITTQQQQEMINSVQVTLNRVIKILQYRNSILITDIYGMVFCFSFSFYSKLAFKKTIVSYSHTLVWVVWHFKIIILNVIHVLTQSNRKNITTWKNFGGSSVCRSTGFAVLH